MKRFLFLFIFIWLASSNFAQEDKYYYWYKGEKQPLLLNNNRWFLVFDEKPDKVTLSNELQIEIDRIDEIKKVHNRDMHNPRINDQYWTVVRSDGIEINLTTYLVSYYAPFFYLKSGEEVGLSHLFYVKLRKAEDLELLEKFADKNGASIIRRNKFMPLWYTLSCSRNSKGNAMELANLFFESGLFSASQPDIMVDNLIQSVNDSYFSDQWNLNNTGQYSGTSGSDIQALDAWKITKSNSGIILAILDHGLEMDHPDLPNIYSSSYDTESGTSPSIVYGNHGVACAGIAGANTNNNQGVAGIAPASQLMSISNSLMLYTGIAEDLADGIIFAYQNGADVISNSWAHSGLQNQLLEDAIDDAVTNGRDGLGTVITFCTQNYNNNSITYPSYLSGVIAVGAVSMCDERKSYTSCDGEQWGSNYGTGIDVVAPGVLIPTTDRQGSSGYNPYIPIHIQSGGSLISDDYDDEDYTIWFNGTSAATPHVAGIAALVLSINPELTLQQVRNSIEGTCEKIGNYTYTLGAGEQSGLTWNNEMGYGRVNAYKALKYTIENYGALLGVGMSQVTLPLWENMTMKEDVNLASNTTLTIEANNLVTISSYSGTVTIGGTGGLSKITSGDLKENGGFNETSKTYKSIPDAFQLYQNYPNPFNPTTVISYSLPFAEKVVIKIYDVLGREIKELVNEFKEAGEYSITFDASSLSSGVYFYRINAGNLSQTKKLILAK